MAVVADVAVSFQDAFACSLTAWPSAPLHLFIVHGFETSVLVVTDVTCTVPAAVYIVEFMTTFGMCFGLAFFPFFAVFAVA